MPIPNLIHPINVTFEFVEKEEMVVDSSARESVFGSRQLQSVVSTVTLEAQVAWIDKDDPRYEGTGATEENTGYLTMRYYDISAAVVDIERGTKIVAIEGMGSVSLFVTKKQPCGHYPGHGATLVRFYFADRKPAA